MVIVLKYVSEEEDYFNNFILDKIKKNRGKVCYITLSRSYESLKKELSDESFEESVTFNIFHEGFSIKKNKFLSEIVKLDSYSIFSFSLENLSKIDKVRFAQALYGRKKDGLLQKEKGIILGQGSFMINVEREEIFKEFMKKWKVKFERRRAFVRD